MQRTIHNNVYCYDFSQDQSLPQWTSENPSHLSKKDLPHSTELLQDFHMPTFCSKIWQSPNGTYIFLTGGYPPQLKCYDVNELSVKFVRHSKSHILCGTSLTSDYTKLALLLEGRRLDFHNQAGVYTTIRIPIEGRAMIFNEPYSDLLFAGGNPAVCRLNLNTGSFLNPYNAQCVDGVTSLLHIPEFRLDLIGCVDGVVRCFSPFTKNKSTHEPSNEKPVSKTLEFLSPVSKLQITEHEEITALSSDPNNAYHFAVGTSLGEVYLYDIRSARPMEKKNHFNALPIVDVQYFGGEASNSPHHAFIVSADRNSVRIWNKQDGANYTSFECPHAISDVLLVRAGYNMTPPMSSQRSGVILLACDESHGGVRFVPSLGVAPKWCSYLETLSNELDHNETTKIYDDYTFVGRSDLHKMGLDEQTLHSAAERQARGRKPVVRPIMNGFFIESKLLRDLRLLAQTLPRTTLRDSPKGETKTILPPYIPSERDSTKVMKRGKPREPTKLSHQKQAMRKNAYET